MDEKAVKVNAHFLIKDQRRMDGQGGIERESGTLRSLESQLEDKIAIQLLGDEG